MRALSKLINENEPELVLFVGEALVGNDGVNQLQMFNQVQYKGSSNLHQLVGVRLIGRGLPLQPTRKILLFFLSWVLVCCLVLHTLSSSRPPFR